MTFPLAVATLIGCHASQYDTEILENGDFEEELSVGWEENIEGDNAGIERATVYDSDSDYEAHVWRATYGTGAWASGYAELSQSVDIQSLHIRFSADLSFLVRVNESVNSSHTFGVAALILKYLDLENEILGETRIYEGSEYCDWKNSDVVHLIKGSAGWDFYSFVLKNEIETNLPGVDPSEVERIAVSLYAYSPEHHGC